MRGICCRGGRTYATGRAIVFSPFVAAAGAKTGAHIDPTHRNQKTLLGFLDIFVVIVVVMVVAIVVDIAVDVSI